MFYKLIKNAVYGKTMENLRKRIDVILVSNKKVFLKQTPKSNYMSQKILNIDLVVGPKSKVTLKVTLMECVY